MRWVDWAIDMVTAGWATVRRALAGALPWAVTAAILTLAVAWTASKAFPVVRADLTPMGLALLAIVALGSTLLALGMIGATRDGAGASARPMAPLIAIVGSDGSGKSTLAGDLLTELRPTHAIRICYLGLGSGELGNRIKRLPLIGPRLERHLTAKATQTRTKGERIPGLGTALVIFGFSLLRRRRFLKMLALRRAGVIVITDRYPQVDVPGFFDGPGLSAAKAGNAAVAWLAARERRMYDWMASHHPDIVIRLLVDAPTAFARKPDHALDLLVKKVEVASQLTFDGASIVDLDSRAPYDEVRRRARNMIDRTIAQSYRAQAAAA